MGAARRIGAWAAATIVAVTGCTADPADPAGSGETSLRVVTSFAVQNLDPLRQGFWLVSWGAAERLMRPTEQGTVEPWVLEELTATSELTWELRLRSGVRFHHGGALDADGLVALLERHVADRPAVTALLAGASFESTGEDTVIATVPQPTPNLPNLLADELITVYDVAAADAAGEDDAALAEAGIYTGPFQVTELTSEALTLARNDSYWDGEVTLPGVEVQFVDEGNARVQAVRGGQADLAFYPPTDALRGLSDPDVSVRRSPIATSRLRAFLNQAEAPLDEPEVRQALALAVDYQEIAQDVLDGFYDVTTSMYPPEVPYAQALVHTDQAEAGNLLDQAGWLPGTDGVRRKDDQQLAVTILSYVTQPDTAAIATAMQAQLSQVGFHVDLDDVPANYAAMEEPGWHVGLSFDSTLGYSFDPIRPLRTFEHSDGVYNLGGITDPQLDQLIDELAATFDEQRQGQLLAQIQQIVVAEQAYTLFLTERPALVVASGDWQGYTPSSVLLNVDATTGP